MTSGRRYVVCLSVGLVLAAVAPSSAQPAQAGIIAGAVADDTNAAVPGVTITATSDERGFNRTTTSDATGRFLLAAMPIGRYTVAAVLTGFRSVTLVGNVVETDKTTQLSIAMAVGSVSSEVTVTGGTPIVDMSNAAVNTRLRSDEFQKLPSLLSYLSLIAVTPGVVGSFNVNSHGALAGDNVYLIDGTNTTDPTTGTWTLDVNYDAMHQISVDTAAVSAEYSGIGAIVNVITKSGTNSVEGLARLMLSNDSWNSQNKTTNALTGAPLSRTRFDSLNVTPAVSIGGPIRKNQAWFFGALQRAAFKTPQRQTVGQVPEEYQQSETLPYSMVRVSAQPVPHHVLAFRHNRYATNGLVLDYWGTAGERAALTAQDEHATSTAVEWNGVLRSNWTGEARYSRSGSGQTLASYENGDVTNRAPHYDFLGGGVYYNGATYNGFTSRPRNEFAASATRFGVVRGTTHAIKAGFDTQHVESSSSYQFPNAQLYIDTTFFQRTRTFVPFARQDYDTTPSSSAGRTTAAYVRDKMSLATRLALEAGVRFERQTGASDVGAATFTSSAAVPRVSAVYDLTGTGKTVAVATYGSYLQQITQTLSDAFASNPQERNYDNYAWNGTQYVFANRIQAGASLLTPNLALEPSRVHEATVGFQRQVGQKLGLGIRGVFRRWHGLIDDVVGFGSQNQVEGQLVNYGPARRSYDGVEATFDRRLSGNWNALGSYVYGRASGNQFGAYSSALGDYLDARCAVPDTTVGSQGIVPCSEVNGGNRLATGHAAYDRPHDLKLLGAYTRPVGRVVLTGAATGEWASKAALTKFQLANVLLPGTTTAAGPRYSYLYEPLGSERLPGVLWGLNAAFEAAITLLGHRQASLRAEIFNVTDQQAKVGATSTLWCNSDSTAACAAARAAFGAATTRGSFQNPRAYQVSALFRF